MNSERLVSVAIPAYKAQFIDAAIESVLSQTYSNLELIIVNDCSPEPIREVVDRYSDPRVRYVPNETNLGGKNPALNWNECLKYARGEFFALLCDDDEYSPTFIESMLELADKNPDCSVFRTRGRVVDACGHMIQKYPASPERESVEKYILSVLKGTRKQTISEFMYRTQRLRDCGGYSYLPLAWHADYLSIFRFALDGGIASSHFSKVLLSFRLSGQNISSRDSRNAYEKILATKLYLDQVCALCEEQNYKDKETIFELLPGFARKHNEYFLRRASKKELIRILKNCDEIGADKTRVLKALIKKRLK